MTEQEAIDLLRKYKPIDQGYVNGGIELENNAGGLAVEMAINALEKHIQKKPKIIKHETSNNNEIELIGYVCPICNGGLKTDTGDSFVDYYLERCMQCGQKINWDEV